MSFLRTLRAHLTAAAFVLVAAVLFDGYMYWVTH